MIKHILKFPLFAYGAITHLVISIVSLPVSLFIGAMLSGITFTQAMENRLREVKRQVDETGEIPTQRLSDATGEIVKEYGVVQEQNKALLFINRFDFIIGLAIWALIYFWLF